jgi:hypothetical protein
MKPPVGLALVVGCTLIAVSPLFWLPCPRGQREVYTQDWELAEFVDYLHAQGIRLRAVTARADRLSGHTVFLTESPDETWESFQLKSKTVERITQWRGSVSLSRLDSSMDPEGLLWQWGPYGCRIGSFVLFGDEEVLERIQRAFGPTSEPCERAR